MRIGIVAGIVVANDAISAAVVGQARIVAPMPEVESVTIFAQHIGRDVPCDGRVVRDPWTLAKDPDFAACDFVLFHWGIHYALFDVLTLFGPERSKHAAVHFHNCTPIDLVHDDNRAQVERSIAQMSHTIGLGVQLLTYSEFNRLTLLSWGADPEDIGFLPFPIDRPTGLAAVRTPDTFELVSVGRFVAAKGQLTLLEALALLPAELRRQVRLHLAGSAAFSEMSYYTELRTRIAEHELAEMVTIVEDPSDAELWELYASGDLVVSTSLHEGLCVPIVEGYAVGCRALGTTEGNLPYLVVSPDEVVPPLNAPLLAAALERAAVRRGVRDAEHEQRCNELVASFSSGSCTTLLRRLLFA